MADAQQSASAALTLFGGDVGWKTQDWTASDDRVRGGKSQSYLDVSPDNKTARFHGTLDIKTLGGAGFASQRTTGEDREWDVSKYAGVKLDFEKGDKKRYTFILKDELLPPNKENGREQATISWEIDLTLPPETKPGETYDKSVFVPWSSLNPTYRGKLNKDAKALNPKHIKRMSLMNRSFFGTQSGDFSLTIKSITALHKAPPPASDLVILDLDTLRQLENGAAIEAEAKKYFHFRVGNPSLISFDLRVHRVFGLAVGALALLGLSAWYARGWTVA